MLILVLPMLLFCFDCGVTTALEVLHSSLPSVGCLCLVGGVNGLGLATAWESNASFSLLGDGRSWTLALPSSNEASAVAELLDSACKKGNFALNTWKCEITCCCIFHLFIVHTHHQADLFNRSCGVFSRSLCGLSLYVSFLLGRAVKVPLFGLAEELHSCFYLLEWPR